MWALVSQGALPCHVVVRFDRLGRDVTYLLCRNGLNNDHFLQMVANVDARLGGCCSVLRAVCLFLIVGPRIRDKIATTGAESYLV